MSCTHARARGLTNFTLNQTFHSTLRTEHLFFVDYLASLLGPNFGPVSTPS